MKKPIQWVLFLLLLQVIFVSFANAGLKTALVIGNSTYKSAPLKNPVNDANDMAQALQDIGFDVIVRTNADEKAMKKSIDLFFSKLKKADIGLFFFAGHGMQIDGHNYLIPVNCDITTATDVEYEAVDAGRVLGKMETAGNRLNIVILDACRDNPFKRSFRTSSKGLAQMDAPKGSIIAYATAPGGVAADGRGRNGIYTKNLLKHIHRSDLTIQEFFNEAGRGVMQDTADAQIPWTSSTPVPRFFLAGIAPEDKNIESTLNQPAAAQKAELYVVTDPGGGRVRIMNIREEYYDGIVLSPGRYKIEGSLEGYQTRTQWITVDKPGVKDVTLTLTKEPATAVPLFSKKPSGIKPPQSRTQKIVARDGDYIKYQDGIVYDKKTGLEWFAGPDTIYQDGKSAQRWVENLKVGGGGWRLPSQENLKGLYKPGTGTRNMTPLLQTTGWRIWYDPAWGFDFSNGKTFWWYYKGSSQYDRAFAVRERG